MSAQGHSNNQLCPQTPLPPLALPALVNGMVVQLYLALLLPIAAGALYYNYTMSHRLDPATIGLPLVIALCAVCVMFHAWRGIGDLLINLHGITVGRLTGPHLVAWTDMECLKIRWIISGARQRPQVVIVLRYGEIMPIFTNRMTAFMLIEILSNHAQAAGHPVEMCITDHDRLKQVRYRA